ncbi:MAG: ATP-binding protein [Desulfovibrio sp.]|nr:ATP-binding protein [Desulfovibrio sp.]
MTEQIAPKSRPAPLREIVVISGKGGTGKTSLTAAFAACAAEGGNAVLCDLDVDTPDLHIVLAPEVRESFEFRGRGKAVVAHPLCVACGECGRHCRFGAIVPGEGGKPVIDPLACEGCGVCKAFCPQQAIMLPEIICGEWHVSETRFGPFVHAVLRPGQENSGRLVSLVKQEARNLARKIGRDTLLCDGSPGTGCPVISSLSGATLAVCVIEPSLSGKSDFERVASVCRHFRIPVGVVINRCTLNPDITEQLEAFCRQEGYAIFGKVPFDASLVRTTAAGLAATEEDTPLARTIRDIWQRIDTFKAPLLQGRPFIPAAPAGS